MNLPAQFLCLALVSGAAAAIHYQIAGMPQAVVLCEKHKLKEHEICMADVKARWPQGVLWVDARKRSEWQVSRAPGAVLWSLEPGEDQMAFEAEVMMKMQDHPVVVVYCHEGACELSREVAKRIRDFGVSNDVYYLHGGVGALQAEGLLKDSKPGT